MTSMSEIDNLTSEPGGEPPIVKTVTKSQAERIFYLSVILCRKNIKEVIINDKINYFCKMGRGVSRTHEAMVVVRVTNH